MLAIRLQRIGRKALPIYRVAVQESQRHPSSGRVIAYVGHYDPHTKVIKMDATKLEFYLKNGAQPTPRVVRLMETEKITLPSWVKPTTGAKKSTTRHPDKLRRNQPKEVPAAEETTKTEAAA
jgi:small subunit ribosomal protein S16